MIAIDTETTGMDFRHGARPFYFSSCDDQGVQRCCEWLVCPYTRQPDIPDSDLAAIRQLLNPKVSKTFRIEESMCDKDIANGSDGIILQNGKFDAHALASIGITPFPWDLHHDTLLAGHLLASNEPHDLTAMASYYLGHNIAPLEKRLEAAVNKARDYCRRHLSDWRIATKGDPHMPSAKDECWRYDYWLPRTLMFWWESSEVPGIRAVLDEHHEWWTVLSDYANEDTRTTIALWKCMRDEMHRLRVWEQYVESRKLPEIFYDMERRGVTVNRTKMRETKQQFWQDSESEKRVCKEIAAACGYDLELPKGGAMNNSLLYFCFNHVEAKCHKCGRTVKCFPEKAHNGDAKCKKCKLNLPWPSFRSVVNLNLPVVALTDGGAPSFDAKRAIPEYLATLDDERLEFVRALASARKLDKAVESMVSYESFGLPYLDEQRKLDLCFNPPGDGITFKDLEDFVVLYPSNNQTATVTLRTSQSNPNGQQVSKQEASCPICNEDGEGKDIDPDCWKCHGSGLARCSIRTMFCPPPGRELWSHDFENLELRIPAYKGPEPAMIALFERPKDPPYFGSNHLLVAHKLHQRLFEQCTSQCSVCKGAGTMGGDSGPSRCIFCHGSGTMMDGRIFKKKYKDTWYQYLKNGNFAIQYGAQEELADRTFRVPGAFKMLKSAFAGMARLNAELMAHATRYGYVKTVMGYPLRVQRSDRNRPIPTQPLSYFVQGTAMECTRLAMPRCRDYLRVVNSKERGGYYMVLLVHDELVFDFPYRPNMGNLPIALELRRIMASSGDDIGVPLTVNLEYHRESWGRGETIKVAA